MIALTMELAYILNSVGFVLANGKLEKKTLIVLPVYLFRCASFPVSSKCGVSLE